jgi:hypothetical protein
MFDGGPLPYEPIEPWRSMQEKAARKALLQDRLKALGAFTTIAIGAVAGFEMVIGGGFDSISFPPELREVAPSNYVTVHQAPWSPDARVVPLSSTEPLFAGDFFAVDGPAERLAGGHDDTNAPQTAYVDADEQTIRAEIEALYEGRSDYTEASTTYEDALASDEPQVETKPDPYAAAEAMVEEALGDYEIESVVLQPS